jgi:KDO2-lipid IV(A) lauroyltransferase
VLKPTSRLFRPLSWAQNLVISGLIGLLRLLPYRQRVPFGGWAVGHVLAPVAGWRRRVRQNLGLIWPDLPKARVEQLVAAVCDNVGRTLAELYSPTEFKAQVANTPITGAGLATILAAQARGQGVILVSGHFGNHDIARAVLAGRGLAVGALYKPQRNPYVERHFRATIGAISEPIFARGRKGLADLVRHLKQGGMLGILIDQHMRHGAALSFLGHRALTATSAADLALKYDCLLVPVYGIRQPDGLSFELVVEDPIPKGTPDQMTQAVNTSLERQVIAHPDQWFWVHRRWK